MAEATKTYIVQHEGLSLVVGQNPRTGIDRNMLVRKGAKVELTDEQAENLLASKAVRSEDDDRTAEEVEQEQAEAEETERLTHKQALQKEARVLELDDSGTINELTSRIAEEKERRAANSDLTGETVNDPALNSGS